MIVLMTPPLPYAKLSTSLKDVVSVQVGKISIIIYDKSMIIKS